MPGAGVKSLIRSKALRPRGGYSAAARSRRRVKVSRTGLSTYPDVIVLCGPPELEDAELDTLLNPQIIIEVLSESTESYDRGKKFRHYQQIPSFREYVLVSQDQPVCERFVRQPDETWVLTTVTGLDRELVFGTVPARVPLTEIYAGVTLADRPGPLT